MAIVFKNEDMVVVKQYAENYEEDEKIVKEISGQRLSGSQAKLYVFPASGKTLEWFHLRSNGEAGEKHHSTQLYHETRPLDREIRYVAKCGETTYAFNGHTLEPCDISDITSTEDKIEGLISELFEILCKKKLKVVQSYSETFLVSGLYAKSIGCDEAYTLLNKRKCITKAGVLKVTLDDVRFMVEQLRPNNRLPKLISLVEDLS